MFEDEYQRMIDTMKEGEYDPEYSPKFNSLIDKMEEQLKKQTILYEQLKASNKKQQEVIEMLNLALVRKWSRGRDYKHLEEAADKMLAQMKQDEAKWRINL